jgi:hypothetical protein
VVIDYKTGYRYLGPAAESHQLRMLALAAARAYDADAVTVGYCFLREDGSYSFSWADFDAFDLAEIADELRDLVERLERKSGSTSLVVHQGDWCDFCPAFESCPAKIRLARAIGSGDAMVQLSDFERQVEAMTSGELARAYEMLEQFDDVANRVRKALKQRAAMRPIDLDDGRRLGAVPWPFTCVKADIAYATVRELHGEEAAERACPRKATLGALKELGGDTLAEVERRRGIVCGSKPQVRVHRP